MAGKLTTHVLDITRGGPASNVTIELWQLDPTGENHRLLKTVYTNADGRTDEPLLVGDEVVAGIYELVFAVGAYFAAQTGTSTHIPFLDRVPIRFGIADPTAHYHVPLLTSPWAYSTYRGS
ncbi:MAG: hydroxyisourate hydrolase [Ktedonobacteraceae bacterium]